MLAQSISGKWQFRQFGSEEWLPAKVPGGVHTDLMAAGLIPDPFVGDNEKRVMWVAESDWEYQRSFSIAQELLEQDQVFLVCDGLDTLAEVQLNGSNLGTTENMFRRYRWQVKPILRPGENTIRIFFSSPVQYITRKQAERPLAGVSQAIPGGPHLRKAPCQFGWDWGPMLPPIGIWKDIRLEGHSLGRLEDVHIRQTHTEQGVQIDAELSIERWGSEDLEALLKVTSPGGRERISQAALPGGSSEPQALSILIPEPRLWWPNGYGEQPLYQVEVSLETRDQVIDQKSFKVGLRQLELRRQPDHWGESFTFVINGVPIIAKGSNWIPADSFPTRITDEHLEHLIRSAAQTHQNMLRVWGGGFYEEDRFYDLCDRYGILVWQDGIFSCSIYPLDEPAFLENVHQEIIENVRRLRHRASLALWCGNNEMEEGWEHWGWSIFAEAGLKNAYEQFFYHTLPEWIRSLDSDHSYWPSSPSSNTPFKDTNGQIQGDAHYWDVWHGRKPFTAYRNQYPRFMSEFGFQSLPPLETIRTYADEPDWNMTSYIMEHHQRNASGNGLMIGQMTDTFRMPKDFPSLVYLTMVLQAEGIRYGVEHWRRNRERVSGTLYWQLNDCWPVASWSSMDYFGRWKALHYTAKRFYAPLLLSIVDTGDRIGVHVTSDLMKEIRGQVRWSLESLYGEILEEGLSDCQIPPLSSQEVFARDFLLSEEQKREVIFRAELLQDGEIVSRNLVTFTANKHLKLARPEIDTEITQQNGDLVYQLTASTLARFVELSLTGTDVVFSDNYFDLPAKHPVKVISPIPAGWTLEKAEQNLVVRSLFDSF